MDCYLVIATFVKAEFLRHCHFYQGGHFGGPLSFDLGGIFRSSSLLRRWNFLKSLPLLSMWNFKVIVKIVSRQNYLVIESFVEKKKPSLRFRETLTMQVSYLLTTACMNSSTSWSYFSPRSRFCFKPMYSGSLRTA